MKVQGFVPALVAVLCGSALLFSCKVNLPDDAKYRCINASDCGQGYLCTYPDAGPPYCCEEGSPGCTALTHEICNGKDDDGDGIVDNGFNLQTDVANCGRCGNACGLEQRCASGACVALGETSCSDVIDNDGDGKIDCADEDCQGLSCSSTPGCVCNNGVKTESNCSNTLDDDDDGLKNCADPDCDLRSCGNGCGCRGGVKSETLCTDGNDNDGDGLADCADSADCPSGFGCKPPPSPAKCSASNACLCNGQPISDENPNCNDGLDNDCDLQIDCADPDCNNFTTGGWRCQNLTKWESICNNAKDDDADGKTDCFDTDCLGGSCGSGGKTCRADGGCS